MIFTKENMSYKQYYAWYDTVKTSDKMENLSEVFQLKDQSKWMKRLRQKNVLYHHNFCPKTQSEEFYYSFLIQHKLWRKETDILGKSSTYEEEYQKECETNTALKIDVEK